MQTPKCRCKTCRKLNAPVCKKCWVETKGLTMFEPRYGFEKLMCKSCIKEQRRQDASGDHDYDESRTNSAVL